MSGEVFNGRMEGLTTADKQRRKNFILGSPLEKHTFCLLLRSTIITATTVTMMTATTATTNDMFYGSRLRQLESNNYKELCKSSCGGAPRMRGLCKTRHSNPFCILRHAILRVDYLILYYISTLDLMSFSFFAELDIRLGDFHFFGRSHDPRF